MLDIVISILFIILGFVFIAFQANGLTKSNLKQLRWLWVIHLFFSFIFYVYTRTNSADTNGYWKVAKQSSFEDLIYYIERGFGTSMMYIVNYLPANILDLSVFSGIIIYAFIGFLGIYFIFKICLDLIPYNSSWFGINLFPALLFFPSIHFWSSGPGKDAIMFFSITMFCYAMVNLKSRFFLAGISLFLCLIIRPHVLIILLTAFGAAYLMSINVKVGKRIGFFILLCGLSFMLLPTVVQYVNIESLTVENALNRLDTQAQNLSGNDINSSFDLQSYPWYLKIFTFLYRPLFLDYNGLFTLITSTENFILLLLSLKAFTYRPIAAYRNAPPVIKASFLFLLLGAIIFSLTLSNFGIILRMKNMFMPGFILYLLWAFSYKPQENQSVPLPIEDNKHLNT